jgi:phage tail sheath protein FI
VPNYLSPGVYVEEIQAGSRPIEGVGTAVAAFVGLAKQGPFNAPKLVSNWSQFTGTFGDFVPGSYLAHAVYGYFMNGGGNCYIVRIGQDGSADGNGNSSRSRDQREIPAGPQAQLGRMSIVALSQPSRGGDITVEVADPGGDEPSPELFKLVIRQAGQVVEEFDRVTLGRGRQNVATIVNAGSRLIRVEESQPASAAVAAADRPATGATVALAAPGGQAAAVPSMRLSADDYVGDVSERTGFGGLEAIDDVTMVAVPDLMSAYQQGVVDLETVQAVQLGMIAHCELMGDRVAIIDPPPGLNAQQVKEWRMDKAGYDSKYAALYWPWIKVFDPTAGRNVYVPPSGHVAGVWGRNDDTRGVHKAPANEVIRGAVTLETQITKTEHGLLNPVGINCIRAFPGGGIRIYGARTLSSDPAWRYLNVRRLFNYLEESILNGTQWVVFEPNDDALWARIRRTISAFLVNEWRRGALFGLTPDEAFYVKCDRETNPAEGIDAGQVVCEIGIAPVKPAEFVIFRLAQFSGGTSLVSE